MSDEYQGKTFKSGNSVALRLPKGMGIPEGTEVRMVKEAPMSFRIEPVEAPRRKIDVSRFAGKAPWLEELPRGDFDEVPRDWHLLEGLDKRG
ncbi:MAG: AbrB/MazE/SpoVT family DNA-binding domain-containing protein [Sphingomonas sp.]|uniref:AbrB/MazE/SpoVT family DNA-binding domain-containing protein n=1 Tax=Sphingomonas sp. TaxID=28214 RepID=UPI0025FC1C6D|nr:AbrB/MazE/SpoVT family DNA-binding domain-containing protein [Sphingomonas sp.]MBY0283681.1 AbrB/MazE/SpoVT family DNA-binding domain-containing protein [Sphingomonas sp.]